MATARSITTSTSYSARRGADGSIELTVEIERIRFVEEVIPDGQMAGMTGHRQVPSTETLTFEIYPAQAQELWEQLGRALGEYPRP